MIFSKQLFKNVLLDKRGQIELVQRAAHEKIAFDRTRVDFLL